LPDPADVESEPSHFRTTAWSVVASAQDRTSPDSQASLQYLCKRYWKPVYRYVRRRGFDHETARDLTQDYFARFLEKGLVEAVDRNRGRFRTFLLTTLSRFLSREYHKARRRPRTVPLTLPVTDEDEREPERAELAADGTPEEEFNRSWARSLILESLRRMRETCTDGNRAEYCRVFLAYIESATDTEPKSYRELAELLGLSETDVTNYLHRGRNIFHKLLREEVRQSVISEDEIDKELSELRRYFS